VAGRARGGQLVYIEPASVRALQETTRVLRSMADTKHSKSLLKEMNKEIREAVQPVVDDQAKAARGMNFQRTSKQGGSRAARTARTLKSGKVKRGRGLREEMARSIRIQISRGANSTGVRIRHASRDADVNVIARRLDSKGKVRHPLFGNKAHWYETQSDGIGWFTATGERRLPWVRRNLSEVLDRWVRDLARGIDRAA